MVKRRIIFGGVDTKDYDAIVDGSESYGGPERDYETVPVPGRNGDLTVDNGRYKNANIPYNMFFTSTLKFEAYRSRILALTGYQCLVDTGHNGEYRMARLSGTIKPKMYCARNRSGEVTITFDCKPQRFLISGGKSITVTSGMTLLNDTGYPAKPLLRVTGAGDLTIGTVTLHIDDHGQPWMDIDCERGDCYWGTDENLNKYVRISDDDFPVLSAGETRITFGAGITQLKITPRWWKL